MKLVIGGAFQGKTDYAKKQYPQMKRVEGFHLFVKQQLEQGISPVAYFQTHQDEYADCVIICDDIFCGVVPMDAAERLWREELGKTIALVSAQCDEVVRVFCGIATLLKTTAPKQ